MATTEDTYGAGVTTKKIFMIPPERLTVISDPNHPLYDKRIHDPLDEGLVLNIMARGVKENIIIRINGKKKDTNILEVVDGRRRTIHAIEANKRLKKLGEPQQTVPCSREDGDDSDAIMDMIALNSFVKRESLMDRVEKAMRLKARNTPDEAIALALGVTKSALPNYFKLAKCVPEVREAVDNGTLAAEAAKKLHDMAPEEQKKALAEMIAAGATKGRKAITAAESAAKGNGARPSQTAGFRMRPKTIVEKVIEAAQPGEADDADDNCDLMVNVLRWVAGDDDALKEYKTLHNIVKKFRRDQEGNEPKRPGATKKAPKKKKSSVEAV